MIIYLKKKLEFKSWITSAILHFYGVEKPELSYKDIAFIKVGNYQSNFNDFAKGQLISKCLIGSIVSTKKSTKFF